MDLFQQNVDNRMGKMNAEIMLLKNKVSLLENNMPKVSTIPL